MSNRSWPSPLGCAGRYSASRGTSTAALSGPVHGREATSRARASAPVVPACPLLTQLWASWRPWAKTVPSLPEQHLYRRPPCSFFVLHTTKGLRVRLDLPSRLQPVLASVAPGAQVTVTGRWRGGSGGSAAAAGTAQAQGSSRQEVGPSREQAAPDSRPCFVTENIHVAPGQGPTPRPRLETASAAGAATAAAGGGSGTVSSNPLVASDVPTIIIPSKRGGCS